MRFCFRSARRFATAKTVIKSAQSILGAGTGEPAAPRVAVWNWKCQFGFTDRDSVGVLKPILVLGIGNMLLMDDGVGVLLVEEFRCLSSLPADEVEFLDGGTQGLALLGRMAGRRALVILDAVKLGATPGTVHCLTLEQALAASSRSTTAHEGNAGELLRMAMMLAELPERVAVIGVEAASLETGLGPSGPVQQAMPAGMDAAREAITAARSPRAPGRT